MSEPIERKPRETCLLKNLAPALQLDLYEHMEGVGDQKGHTYAECAAWLAARDVVTTAGNLGKWRAWYLQRLRFQWCRETIEMILEDDRERGQKYSDEDIQRKGNRMFSLLAIHTCDDKAWARAQTLATRKQAVATIERKLEFEIKKYEDQRAKVKDVEADARMTPEEKQRRIREILGTE